VESATERSAQVTRPRKKDINRIFVDYSTSKESIANIGHSDPGKRLPPFAPSIK
jgi:hypothetical protein